MTIQDLYNALEKAIDSGAVRIDNKVLIQLGNETAFAETFLIDCVGDIIIAVEE